MEALDFNSAFESFRFIHSIGRFIRICLFDEKLNISKHSNCSATTKCHSNQLGFVKVYTIYFDIGYTVGNYIGPVQRPFWETVSFQNQYVLTGNA